MIETKSCQHCGKAYTRQPRHSSEAWRLTKYCSRRCAAHKPSSKGWLERFFSFVSIDANTKCWLWDGAKDSKGYGFFNGYRAHRQSFLMCVGDIPDGMMVLHRCDVCNCVNPYHLFLGTGQDNADDKHLKGRASYARGEQCGSARLTEFDVRAILADDRPQQIIARQYGVAQTTISAIKRRQNWNHIGEQIVRGG